MVRPVSQWLGWPLAALIALPTLVALSVVLASLIGPTPEPWVHLREHVLGPVIVNSLWLVLGVGIFAAVVGTAMAWLTAMCEFPGRALFTWALILPLAMPAYVSGFAVIGLLEYAGPVQTGYRALAGADAPFFQIRSRTGIILVMGLALYPYVYMLARNAFLTQGRSAFEAAQSLGASATRGFWQVALPMARPWILGACALVAMETLADFGTVSVFNYDTFTTAIYKSWFALFSLDAALQLASVLLLFVFVALLAERALHRANAYVSGESQRRDFSPLVLSPVRRWLATGAASAVLLLGFVVPFAQLLVWCVRSAGDELNARYLSYVLDSLGLAAGAAILISGLALLLAYCGRVSPQWPVRVLSRVATLGYALPGTVLAVGLYVPLAGISGTLDNWRASVFEGTAEPMMLQTTVLTMLVAYLVRFLAVAHNPLERNMMRITTSLDEAARSLGAGRWQVLGRVHLPMLRGGMVTAALLVFVDVMKEMPITLMTRPFGVDTLAVRVFEMTAEGQWERAAWPAVSIVLVGLLPVILLVRKT